MRFLYWEIKRVDTAQQLSKEKKVEDILDEEIAKDRFEEKSMEVLINLTGVLKQMNKNFKRIGELLIENRKYCLNIADFIRKVFADK